MIEFLGQQIKTQFHLNFMKLVVFLIFWMIPNLCSAECLKEITVKVVYVRSNPSLLAKVKEKVKPAETKKVLIDCSLHEKVKIGDELTEPGDPVESFRLFSKDQGYLQRKHYIVLEK